MAVSLALACALVSTSYSDDASKDREDRIQSLTDFAIGTSKQILGEEDAALESFTASVLKDPSSIELVYQVVEDHIRKEDWKTTLKVLQRAREAHPDEAKLWFLEGVSHQQLGDSGKARRALETSILKDPGYWPPRQQLIAFRLENGELDKVNELLKDAALATVDNAAFFLDLTQIHFDPRVLDYVGEKQVKTRVSSLLDRVEKTALSSEPPILQRMADYAFAIEDYDRAENYLEQVLHRFPNALLPRRRLVEIYMRSNQDQKALDHLQALTRLEPANEMFYYLLGGVEQRLGQLDEAFKDFKMANQLAPAFLPPYYELISIHLTRGESDQALKVWTALMTKAEPQFLTHFYRALIAASQKDYQEAVSHLGMGEKWALENDPNRLSAAFYFQFGAYLERAGDYEASALRFKKSLELQPDNAEALNYLGYMWADLGIQLEEALEMIARAVEMEPENPAYLDSLAWVHFKLGRLNTALQHINKAVALMEEPDPVLLDHLGDIQKANGKPEEARESWKRSLELEDSLKIREKLD